MRVTFGHRSRFRRFSSRILIALQFFALTLLVPLSMASAAPAAAATPAAANVSVAPTTVNFSNAARSAAATTLATSRRQVAFHPRDLNTYTAAKAAANRQAASGATAQTVQQIAATGSLVIDGGFPTITVDQQTTRFGNTQDLEPPDPYVAVGTNYVVQTNNSVMSVWTKSGSLVSAVDLNVFAQAPSGWYFVDPRILYDSASGRWYLSGEGLDANNDGAVLVFVSQTSDPTGLWSKYVFGVNNQGISRDQPKLGINDDKVVIAWGNYSTLAFNSFTGSQILVLQKADLVAGSAVAGYVTPSSKSYFDIVPAQSLSSTTTEYLVYNNADPALSQNQSGPTVGVISVTGTPRANDVALSETDLPMTATQAPPLATQPGGTVETNDDRFLNAVWQNGILWTGGNNGCTPAGDTSLRSCLRLVEISTIAPSVAIGPPMTLVQATDYAIAGNDLYYPAVGLDSSNNLVVVFSGSSATTYPSIAAFGALAGTTISSANAPVLLAKGLDTYSYTRWGDYSGAAVDPSDPTKVWVAGEYSAAPSGNWGTALAEVNVP